MSVVSLSLWCAVHTTVIRGISVPEGVMFESRLLMKRKLRVIRVKWPEVLTAGTQSFQTEFNPHPSEPRVIIIDQNMIREVLMLVY